MKDPPITMATVVKPRVESRLQPLSFEALAPDGSNFLEWNNDAKTYPAAEELEKTLDHTTATELLLILRWQIILLLC